MHINHTMISIQDLGTFWVDEFMKITFFPHAEGYGSWESHISKLNEAYYREEHDRLMEFISDAEVIPYIDIHEFKAIMEKVFQAYCLLR